MTRQWQSAVRTALAAVFVLGTLFVAPASAQVYQVSRTDSRNLIGFNLGYFALKSAESRDSEDILLPNLIDFARRSDLAPLEIGDFNSVAFGGEWIYGVSDYLEAGVGLGYYRRTVETVYADLVDDDESDIAQDLKLRVVPITATVRFLPFGRGAAVEPYVGAGIGFFNYRYTEIGEFVDDEGFVFTNVDDPFDKSGTAIGPVVLLGARFPVGDAFTLGGEFRWQKAEGDGLLDQDFIRDKIDLGGWTSAFTFHFRF